MRTITDEIFGGGRRRRKLFGGKRPDPRAEQAARDKRERRRALRLNEAGAGAFDSYREPRGCPAVKALIGGERRRKWERDNAFKIREDARRHEEAVALRAELAARKP